MRRSDLMQTVANKLSQTSASATSLSAEDLERSFNVEHVPQTTVIELRGEGSDRNQLVSALSAWIDVYVASRKDTDRTEGSDALEEAKHEARVAQKAVDDKQREIDAFRQRHGITSVERDENPGAARLKGLHTSLNDAADREVKAEARLKAVQDSLDQGRAVIRNSDKAAIAALEMRAVELRERIRDSEQVYTKQYLSLDPKHKALQSNLARIEQQIQQEKERSQKAALSEAQEELTGARGATQKIRQQADSLKVESQAFSTRFVELKRMGVDLEQLQETRRIAVERQAQLESARKPAAVRIRVLSAPAASETPIAPDYSRDAAIALAAGLALAIVSVWLYDYLRRTQRASEPQPGAPIIQIAYPVMQPHAAGATARLAGGPAGLLGASPLAGARELSQSDVSALWSHAPRDERLVIAAIFNGVAPGELAQLRWSHVDLQQGLLHVPGSSARVLPLVDPMRSELNVKADSQPASTPQAPLFADGAGNPLDEPMIDGQLACVAHDAGLRDAEEVTTRCLHFTYAAYLARQGIRMVDLAATIGRISTAIGAELMRLVPPAGAATQRIERVYPSFRAAET
jgi:uncharacterized protein involved in exopolysaccharide biosynthesis